MGGMFTWLKKRGYVAVNPFDDIQRKPKRLMRSKKRRLLSDEEIHRLVAHLSESHLPYLCICLFCYCCFMRPKEIAMIRCGDIDLDSQTIRVHGNVAKNGRDSVRTIPAAMIPYLMRLEMGDMGMYLFAAHRGDKFSFTPGDRPTIGQRIADYWRFYVRPALHFEEDVQFYSLKDTGITHMIDIGIPLTFVQQQADHSSIAMTAIYVGRSPAANDALKEVDVF